MIEIVLDINYDIRVMYLDLERLDKNYPNRYKTQKLNTYLELTGQVPFYDPDVNLLVDDIYFFSTLSTKVDNYIDTVTLFNEGILSFHDHKGIYAESEYEPINFAFELRTWYPTKFVSEITGHKVEKINRDGRVGKIDRYVPKTDITVSNKFNGVSLNEFYGKNL
tara:strand:+ start:1640 stop:2134 length:495 start_codon:yes stop_codon:yes gene_type:complete